MNDEFAINNRVQQIMQEKGLTNAAFADAIGVNRSSISQLLSCRNKPSLDFLDKLLRTFKDVDANWLLKGEKSATLVIQSEESQTPSLFSQTEKNEEKKVEVDTTVEKTQKIENIVPIHKKIEKIVTFYTDKTFAEYYPE